MDYYNFDPEVYRLKFSSRGDATLSRRVLQLFQNVLLLRISSRESLAVGAPLTPIFL